MSQETRGERTVNGTLIVDARRRETRLEILWRAVQFQQRNGHPLPRAQWFFWAYSGSGMGIQAFFPKDVEASPRPYRPRTD